VAKNIVLQMRAGKPDIVQSDHIRTTIFAAGLLPARMVARAVKMLTRLRTFEKFDPMNHQRTTTTIVGKIEIENRRLIAESREFQDSQICRLLKESFEDRQLRRNLQSCSKTSL
jgi:hypothetical protein